MARESAGAPPESVISIIGPGMKVVGDCHTDGTVRVEGTVEGSVQAGKAVVIGKNGVIKGDVVTQDAVISGRVVGKVIAHSRLELQATCRIEGEVHTRRMQLEEGAVLNGTVTMAERASKGEAAKGAPAAAATSVREPAGAAPDKR